MIYFLYVSLLLLLNCSLYATEPRFIVNSLDKKSNQILNANFQDIGVNKADDSVTVKTYGTQTIAGNKTLSGFTALGTGNIAIKIKRLTGTTAASEGGLTAVAHGLTGSKIIGWTAKVEYNTNSGNPTGDPTAGYSYYSYHDGTNFNLKLHATESENILTKPFTIVIFYNE